MRIQVITIFPELFAPFLATSLVGRAVERGLLEVEVHDLRDHTADRHRSVDDEPYGGGGGMVMTAPPWIAAVRAVAGGRPARRVLLSPQGRRLDDPRVRELAGEEELVLLCGRYEGVDERVLATVVDEDPDGPESMTGYSDQFFAPDVPAELREQMMAFSAQVGAEDDALVRSVQRGLRSGMVPQGRLLLGSEALIHHFQGLVYEALSE